MGNAKRILEHIEFIANMDLSIFASFIEMKGYKRSKKPHYNVEGMLKLLIFKEIRKLTFRDAVRFFPERYAFKFGFVDKEGNPKIPSKSTLHYFALNKLHEVKFDEFSIFGVNHLVKKLHHLGYKGKLLVVDSTPVYAATHSKYEFNYYYQTVMEKSHLSQIEFVNETNSNSIFFPLHQIISKGNENDLKSINRHIRYISRNFKECLKNLETVSMDAIYDCFKVFADIFYYLIPKVDAKIIINPRSDAKWNKCGTEKYINKVVNKNWKIGGNLKDSFKNKLIFLCKIGKKEIVGKYFRNIAFRLKKDKPHLFYEIYQYRKFCEPRHGNIKRTVKFDVIHERYANAHHYLSLRLMIFQIYMIEKIIQNVEVE